MVTKIPKKGRGPATLFGQSDMLEKNLKIILDHYLLDAKRIMQKYSTVERIILKYNMRSTCMIMTSLLVISPYWESSLPETLYNMLQLHNMSKLHIIEGGRFGEPI